MKTDTKYKRSWRKEVKNIMVDAMGGCCQICGYNKSKFALDFHHIFNKDFAISTIISNPKKWKDVIKELKKCVLLCSNCHRELHAGEIMLPELYATFNYEYINFKFTTRILKEDPEFDKCPMCGEYKNKSLKFCSQECAKKNTWRIDWDNVDIIEVLEKTKKTNGHYNFLAAGKELSISDNAVRKRYKKVMASLASG